MKVNRHEIFKQILNHKFEQDFFQFIDFINANNSANEFPTILYVNFYDKKVRVQADPALLNIMSLDVLLDNGIFLYEDKNTGRIAMSDAVYSFFTFIDMTRSRQLDNIQFEAFRAEIQETVTIITTTIIGSDDYMEAFNHFYTLIAKVISAIKDNLEVLNHKVSEISALYQQKEQGLSTISVNDLFEKAQKLYDRNIQPCLDFIDPNRKMKEADTFIDSLNKLYHYYQRESMAEEANVIQYKGTAVTSYYKDIGQLSERVRQYLNNLAEDRKYFMVIERAFDNLIDAFKPLRHGRTQNRFLHGESHIMTLFSSLDGLSTFRRSFSACFNRDPESVMLQFKIFHIDLQERAQDPSDKALKPITDLNETLEFQRVNQILNLLGLLQHPSIISDIYRYVYDCLADQLEDMTLLDCLHGIGCLLSLLDGQNIVQGDQRCRLVDDHYYLDYVVLGYHKGETQ